MNMIRFACPNWKKKILTYREAANLGLQSRSAWKKEGVVIPKEAVPSAAVLRQGAELFKASLATTPCGWEIIVRTEEKFLLFAKKPHWFPVYSRESVVFTEDFQILEKPLYSTEFELPLSLPAEQEEEGREERETGDTTTCCPLGPVFRQLEQPKSNNDGQLHPPELSRKTRRGRPPVNRAPWAYVPESLTPKDKLDLGPDLEFGLCVMHTLHYFRVSGKTKKGKDDWIDLSCEYLRKALGGNGKTGRNWDRVRELMLTTKIMEKTADPVEDEFGLGVEIPRGVKGGRCFGYRL